MLPIQERLIKYNFTPNANKVEYIVVHDTGNFNKGANAEMHFAFFNGADRQASAHYFVDDHSILQLVKDCDKAWHCGDGGNKYGIGNQNSIGIEMCVASDLDKHAVQENTLDLIVFLMKKYNVPFEKVVRHYDASRKNCPQTLNVDGKWSGWIDFNNRLKVKITPTPKPVVEVQKPVVTPAPVLDFKEQALKELNDKGIVSDYAGWKTKLDAPAPVWLVFVLVAKIVKLFSKN